MSTKQNFNYIQDENDIGKTIQNLKQKNKKNNLIQLSIKKLLFKFQQILSKNITFLVIGNISKYQC